MKLLRKIVSTVLVAALIFFAPSLFAPSLIPANARLCGVTWLPTDTAFAQVPCPVPASPTHGYIPAWFWAAFACSASIIFSGAVANFRDNRQLTYAEAWTCGLLYWFGKPPAQQKQR